MIKNQELLNQFVSPQNSDQSIYSSNQKLTVNGGTIKQLCSSLENNIGEVINYNLNSDVHYNFIIEIGNLETCNKSLSKYGISLAEAEFEVELLELIFN